MSPSNLFIFTYKIKYFKPKKTFLESTAAHIRLPCAFSMRRQITYIGTPPNIATGGGSESGIGLFQRWMCLAAFGHSTKPAKGNIGIIWWGIPNVSGEPNCHRLNDKYMLLVVESDSAGCPQVLCGCQHYSICPWRCWLKMLSSAQVASFVPGLLCVQFLLPIALLSVQGILFLFNLQLHGRLYAQYSMVLFLLCFLPPSLFCVLLLVFCSYVLDYISMTMTTVTVIVTG